MSSLVLPVPCQEGVPAAPGILYKMVCPSATSPPHSAPSSCLRPGLLQNGGCCHGLTSGHTAQGLSSPPVITARPCDLSSLPELLAILMETLQHSTMLCKHIGRNVPRPKRLGSSYSHEFCSCQCGETMAFLPAGAVPVPGGLHGGCSCSCSH